MQDNIITQVLSAAAPRTRTASVQGGMYNPNLGISSKPAAPPPSNSTMIVAGVLGTVVVVATVAGVVAMSADHDPYSYRNQRRAQRRAARR